MLVAVGTWELHLPGCHSLKEKRGILKPLTTRLGKTLNVSVAETAYQDLWQRAEVACAAVASDRRVAEPAPGSSDPESGPLADPPPPRSTDLTRQRPSLVADAFPDRTRE